MDNSFRLFSALQNSRYSITFSLNGAQVTQFQFDPTSSTWELTMNVTYEQLRQRLLEHFELVSESPKEEVAKSRLQQYRNHLSTLTSFLASAGKTLEARVGVELGSGFDAAQKHYFSVIDVSPRTKRDRRHHLNIIRLLHDKMSAPPGRKTEETSFSAELRAQIARTGLAPKTLATQVGVSTSAIQRWLAGAIPNQRGLPTLRRLETALGLPRDRLVALVKKEIAGSPDEEAVQPPSIAYRDQLRARTLDTYILPEASMSVALQQQWRDLFDHKTSVDPDLERAPRGQWRLVPAGSAGSMSKLAQDGSMKCPTAAIELAKVRTFLGFLTLNIERGGLGQAVEHAQTLSWLAHRPSVEAFLKFSMHRSGGLKHMGQKTFCQSVACLVREKTGYLWQRPDLANSLPPEYRPEGEAGWHEACARTHKFVTAWKKKSKDISRRPAEPIGHLLELDNPLDPMLAAIEAIERAAANLPTGSTRQAVLMRDACLLAMLCWNPLRLRNWQTITWRRDNNGRLYRTGNQNGWRLCIPAHELKNGEAEGAPPYDVAVDESVVLRLTAYLEEYRPILLKGHPSDYLFVSSHGPDLWESMGGRIRKVTRQYLRGSPGVGPHAFRHLLATNFLQRNPDAFGLVADLLNDEVNTVLKAYAHLRRGSSLALHEAHLHELLAARTAGRSKG